GVSTCPMGHSGEVRGSGAARIKEFTPELTPKILVRVGSGWYASDTDSDVEIESRLPEELGACELLLEGASRPVTASAYERNATARARCLQHHGYSCIVCSFNFKRV